MRVAFWSNYPGSGVTSNMISLGAAMSLLYKARIILTSNHYGMRDLGRCITGAEGTETERQTNLYYRNRDFYYPYKNGVEAGLKLYIDSAGRYIKNGFSPKEPENGLYCYLFEKEYSDYLYEVNFIDRFGTLVDRLEERGEFVFMDLQSQGSFCTLQELERADLVVVSLRQEEKAVRNFFKRYESITGKSIFLLSGYKRNGAYLKKDIVSDFHLHPERVAIMPYSREIASGYADGRVLQYICENIDCGARSPEHTNFWHLKRAAAVLMQALENGVHCGQRAI
ncbi:MAG: hypothetical protein J6U10_03915 [Lachnospiraceae bacterium]|nr:hypothetical protein [Lachnospiraceae bacterium]